MYNFNNNKNKIPIGIISDINILFNYIYHSLYCTRYVTHKDTDSIITKDFYVESNNWNNTHSNLYMYATKYISNMA